MAQHGGIQLDGGISRAISVVFEPMRVADVVLRDHEEFPGLKVFSCKRLKASITPATCASNHVNRERYAACQGCNVGTHYLAQQSVKPPATSGISSTTRQPGPVAAHCVRCGKSSETDTSSIGRVRFVNKGTECVSCFNRKSEVAKGSNSKHATPKLWAALRQATITYETGGKIRTEDIGLRSSRHECERWLAHVHPGAALIECVIDSVSVPPFAGEHPLYHGREVPDLVGPRKPAHFYPDARAAKQKITYSKPTKLKLAAEAMDADGDEFGYCVHAPVKPKAKTDRPSQSRVGRPRKNAAEETLADFGFGVEDELLDFAHWLANGWPQSMPREPVTRRRGRKLIDIMGQRFGKLTAMMHVGSNERGDLLWRCACDCGNAVITRGDMLRAGESKSCGCSRRKSAKPSDTADFGFGEEDWSTPLHKIAKTVTAESEHSDADGNGCARRNGWLPPLSEADDLEYRRSFDEDEAAEPMESVAEPEALPEVAEAASEPENAPQDWTGCEADGVLVTDYAREHGISDHAAAVELGMTDPDYDDEPAPTPAVAEQPAPEPEPGDFEPLTRKERRAYERMSRKLAKKAERTARAATAPSIAQTARAVIGVMHKLHEARK